MQATLIVNPAAGRARLLSAQLPQIVTLLAGQGITASVVHTTPHPDSARTLATACPAGSLVLACGGDGTIHGVVQGLAHRDCTLGVVPLGTANALARNLGLPLDPLAAVARLLTWQPRTIALGEAATSLGPRLFTVMAGCGPDGELARTIPASAKSSFGRSAYYAHAARLFLTRRWPAFRVDYRLAGQAAWQSATATALLASRVPNLGGLFAGLTPRAALAHPHLHVQLLRPPAQLSFPMWFALGRTRLPNRWLLRLNTDELRCTPLTSTPIQTQTDAEPTGPLPLTLRMIPNALRLLMP